MKWFFVGIEAVIGIGFFYGWYITGGQFDLWISGFATALAVVMAVAPEAG